jgi:hypothetical protein
MTIQVLPLIECFTMKRAEFDSSSASVNTPARAGLKLGLELEMGVVDQASGASHPVQGYLHHNP